MPLPQLSCSIPDDVCCTTTFDLATFILNRTYDKLAGCLPLDCNGQPMVLRRYVTMGQGDDGVADSLTVAFQGAIPSPNSLDRTGHLGKVSVLRADFDVRLRESGWPIVATDGGKIDAPDPVIQQKIARHAYAHGEQMYRALRSMVNITHPDDWLQGYPLPVMSLGGLRTINPSGGMVGFSAIVTMDLPWGILGR